MQMFRITKYIIKDGNGAVLCKCHSAKGGSKSVFIKEQDIGRRSGMYGNPLMFNHRNGAVKNLMRYELDGTARASELSEQEALAEMTDKGLTVAKVSVSFEESE